MATYMKNKANKGKSSQLLTAIVYFFYCFVDYYYYCYYYFPNWEKSVDGAIIFFSFIV